MTQPPTTGAADERYRARSVAFWLAAGNLVLSLIMGLAYLRRMAPVADASVYSLFYLPLAYLSHFAAIHLLFFGLACLVIRIPHIARWAPAVFFALTMPLVHLLFYINSVVFTNYGMHLNSAIIEMLVTPGAQDLFEFSLRDVLKVGSIVALVAVAQVAGALVISRLAARRPAGQPRRRRYIGVTVVVILVAVLVEKGLYAWADATSGRDVLVNARVIPFQPRFTAKRLLRRFGVNVDRQVKFRDNLALDYPRQPLVLPADGPAYNVLWVAVEGWRFDMLDPAITPRLSKFAARCLSGKRHYSSGNCTRLGIFGMFYGLDGLYWRPILTERRGPEMLRALRQLGYQFLMMGSANFTNPEMLLTCFSEMEPDELIHGSQWGEERNYNRDLRMIEQFTRFLGDRDPARPFFSFMFLDSTHAPYNFQELPGFIPPLDGYTSTVRHDKLFSDPAERDNAFIRYRNSVSYIDHLIGEALDELETRGLLDRTIVMIGGDHGEEFGEHGYFGHNGNYTDYQARTPFIFHYPGVQPGTLTNLTSHLDWAPTTLTLLGLDQPAADYCQGQNVLDNQPRSYVVAASYSNAGIITDQGYRLVFPLLGYRMSTLDIYDATYAEPPDRDAALRACRGYLTQVLRDSGTFRK